MAIPPELEASILRYHHVEKWRVGTIARQLGVHPDTVARALARAGLPRQPTPGRSSAIDPYLPFILQTLQTWPTLTAARLYEMVRERGYRGARDHFRHLIARHRPRRRAEAYLRLRTLPGNRPRWTGPTSATSRSDAPAGRRASETALRVPDEEERLILATGRYIGEGFDDPRLDTLFLTMPISWKGTLAQYVGRLHRQHGGKTEVVVVDYVDEAAPILARMAAKRRTGYRALGYTLE